MPTLADGQAAVQAAVHNANNKNLTKIYSTPDHIAWSTIEPRG